LCFREIGLLLLSALKSNGLECDFTFNKLAEDRINIILGYHLIRSETDLKSYHYIVYQLEQLGSKEFPFSSNMERILRQAVQVWDYSHKNILFLENLGISARYLVPGYHRNLEMVPADTRRTIDVLFYGSIAERRRKALTQLSERCKLKILFGVYGEKRDQWICRSQVVLNVHHYSQQIFEAVRVSYLLNNGVLVISEEAENLCYPKVDLITTSYERLIDTCIDFLKDPQRMEKIRSANYLQFKEHYPMTELLQLVLI